MIFQKHVKFRYLRWYISFVTSVTMLPEFKKKTACNDFWNGPSYLVQGLLSFHKEPFRIVRRWSEWNPSYKSSPKYFNGIFHFPSTCQFLDESVLPFAKIQKIETQKIVSIPWVIFFFRHLFTCNVDIFHISSKNELSKFHRETW